MRICWACKTQKQDDCFSRCSQKLGGRRSICRVCDCLKRREREKRRRAEDPGYRERREAYFLSSERKAWEKVYQAEYRAGSPGRSKARIDLPAVQKFSWRAGRLIPIAEIEKMMAAQGNLCLICGLFSELVVDHNHKTGEIRGMLCRQCNFGIGLLKESPATLRSAIAYLERFSEKGGVTEGA